jgi:threonine dehydrogenase-like Zn-dependent dehydrogenase
LLRLGNRHPSDRVAGRRALRNQGRRDRRGLGCRARWLVRHQVRSRHGSRTDNRYRGRAGTHCSARKAGATDIIKLSDEDVIERIKEITDGQGPDAVIDCVGMEASSGGHGLMGVLSAVQQKLTSTQRPYALEQMITAVRPCGIVSVPGVYGGPIPVNMGSFVQKGLTMKSGQTHVKRYLEPLTKLIQDGTIDPGFLITHRDTTLAEGPDLYKTFRDKLDGCVKVVFNLN